MKKIVAIMVSVVMLMSLAACGGGGNADSKYEGNYISVAGEAMGMTMTGDDIAGFSLNLKSGGKGTITVEGESHNIRWSNEGDTITVKVSGEELVAAYEDGALRFSDFLGMGMNLVLALEGSPAADPSLYLSAEDQAMVGNWTSHTVTDVLGDDASAEISPTALSLELYPDHTGTGALNGEDLKLQDYTWSGLGNWACFDDAEGCVISSWETNDDGELEVTYDDGDNYWIFICSK